MASTSSASSPSAFATLLRRSKFASYDPGIGQVYTAPLAHRARGTFGFKRPVPMGPRSQKFQYITVSAAETPWNVMMWESGERSARWTSRMDELRPPFEPPPNAPDSTSAGWNTWLAEVRPDDMKTWYDESEFAQALGDDTWVLPGKQETPAANPTKNWDKLQHKGFSRFLEEKRGLREEFKDWILAHREKHEGMDEPEERREFGRVTEGGAESMTEGEQDRERRETLQPSYPYDAPNMYELYQLLHTRRGPSLFFEFLRQRQSEDHQTQLIPAPHPIAALSYQHPSKLQTFLDTPPVSGIVMGQDALVKEAGQRTRDHQRANRFKKKASFFVGIAGHVGQLSPKDSGGKIEPTQLLEDDPHLGRPRFRVWSGELLHPPRTAEVQHGLRPWEDVNSARLDLRLREVTDGEAIRNSSRPGSPQYVGKSLEESLRQYRDAGSLNLSSSPTTILSRSTPSANSEKENEEIMDLLGSFLPKDDRRMSPQLEREGRPFIL